MSDLFAPMMKNKHSITANKVKKQRQYLSWWNLVQFHIYSHGNLQHLRFDPLTTLYLQLHLSQSTHDLLVVQYHSSGYLSFA